MEEPKTGHSTVQFESAHALARIGGKQVVRHFLHLLELEGLLNAQSQAIYFLGETKAREAVPALLRTLHSKSVYLRTEAANALARIGDVRAVPFLWEIVAHKEDVGLNLTAAYRLEELLPRTVPEAQQPLFREAQKRLDKVPIPQRTMVLYAFAKGKITEKEFREHPEIQWRTLAQRARVTRPEQLVRYLGL